MVHLAVRDLQAVPESLLHPAPSQPLAADVHLVTGANVVPRDPPASPADQDHPDQPADLAAEVVVEPQAAWVPVETLDALEIPVVRARVETLAPRVPKAVLETRGLRALLVRRAKGAAPGATDSLEKEVPRDHLGHEGHKVRPDSRICPFLIIDRGSR